MPDVSMKHCPYCRAACDIQDTFCGKCGQPFIGSVGHTITNDGGQSQTIQQSPALPYGSVSQLSPVPTSSPLPGSNTFSTIPSSNSTLTSNTVPAASPSSSPLPSFPSPPPQHYRPTKYLVIIAVLLVLLAGGAGIEIGRLSSSVSIPALIAGKTTTSQPTRSARPQSGDVLYQEDGSDNWKGWSGSVDWKILNRTLINDGTYDTDSEPPTITSPYYIQGTTNYAVEARVRVLRQTTGRQLTPYFGISVRGTSAGNGWQGYWASVIAANSYALGTDLYIQNNVANNFSQSVLASAPFDPGTDWHTYRVEVNGNDIKVLVDGVLALETQDNQFLTGGQIGFGTADTELVISSFKIIAL
jgi:Domain of Unknown Function (DUF1080)